MLHAAVFKLREAEKRTESINLRLTSEELAEINWCIEQLVGEFGRVSSQDVARLALGLYVAQLRGHAAKKPAAKRKTR